MQFVEMGVRGCPPARFGYFAALQSNCPRGMSGWAVRSYDEKKAYCRHRVYPNCKTRKNIPTPPVNTILCKFCNIRSVRYGKEKQVPSAR